jgi:hypothetical protein
MAVEPQTQRQTEQQGQLHKEAGNQDQSLVEAQKESHERDSDEEGDVQFRTVQQQQKYENYLKQKAREEGRQSARSRSESRRARRKRMQEAIDSGKYMKTTSLEALEEADASGELQNMGMFERIGPDSTSMDGPVTHARAMRGEIPMRGTNPNQPYKMPKQDENALDKQEGLKLTLEANLDIEIELKASIRGDLTLSLL